MGEEWYHPFWWLPGEEPRGPEYITQPTENIGSENTFGWLGEKPSAEEEHNGQLSQSHLPESLGIIKP